MKGTKDSRSRRAAAATGALALAALLGAWAAAAPPAAAAEPLTLAEAARRALAQHPAVGAAEALRDEARAAAGEAGASRYPTVRLAGSATRHEEPMVVAPLHGFTPGQLPSFSESLLQGNLSVGYTLFDGGGRPARLQAARSRAAAAEAGLDAASQALLARVAATYIEAVVQLQVGEAHARRLAALAAEQGRVRALREQGRAAALEVLRVEAALAGAEAERVRADAAREVAERELARLIGGSPEQTAAALLAPVALAGAAPAPRDSLVAQALRRSPAVAQNRRQQAAARAGLAAARGARWPELRLSGNLQDYSGFEGDHATEWSVGAQVTMPLFTGGAVSSAVARAAAAGRGADAQLRLAELQLQQDIDRVLAAAEEARARVGSLERAVAAHAEVARIEQLALAAGSGTQTDFLAAEADLLAARAGLAEARAREIASRVELARLAGDLSLDWLARNLEEER